MSIASLNQDRFDLEVVIHHLRGWVTIRPTKSILSRQPEPDER